jgi:hypothetical protein
MTKYGITCTLKPFANNHFTKDTTSTMKKVFLLAACFFLYIGLFAQQIRQVIQSQTGAKTTFCFYADQNILIYVSPDGNVTEWGVEYTEGRMYYYPGKLDNYMGRIDMYGPADNVAFRGKLRYIGAVAITYYTAEENQLLAGKVKSIGSSVIDYYGQFDEAAFRGKIKSAGTVSMSYFGSFDNEALKGKLKSVSNIAISYYNSFDDKAIKGKVKSIGSYPFAYYSSFDTRMPGALKTGFQKQIIDGIRFIIWG